MSYFVKAGSALDEVASSRATSVYLVQRVSSVCSRPGVSRRDSSIVAFAALEIIASRANASSYYNRLIIILY